MQSKKRPLTQKEFEEGRDEIQAMFDGNTVHLWEAFDERLSELDTLAGCREIQRYADEHKISFLDAYLVLAPTEPGVPRPEVRRAGQQVQLDETELNRKAVALADREGVTLDVAIDRTLEGQ